MYYLFIQYIFSYILHFKIINIHVYCLLNLNVNNYLTVSKQWNAFKK